MYTDIALEFHVKLNLNHLHARLNTITKGIHRNHRILDESPKIQIEIENLIFHIEPEKREEKSQDVALGASYLTMATRKRWHRIAY